MRLMKTWAALVGALALVMPGVAHGEDPVLRVASYGYRMGRTFYADAGAISFPEATMLGESVAALELGQGRGITCVANEPTGQKAVAWYRDVSAFDTLRKTYEAISGAEGPSATFDELTLTNGYEDASTVYLAVEFAYIQYSVVLDQNGGSGGMESPGTCSYNDTWRLPACTYEREGYRFIGWRQKGVENAPLIADAALVSGESFTIANHDDKGVVTLLAQWEKDTFAITATASRFGGGTVTPEETLAKTNTTVVLTATAGTGGTFWRWSDGVEANPRTVLVVSNAAYRADFVPVRSCVTFDPNLEGATVWPASRLVAYGSAYGTLPTPVRAGRSFKHWAADRAATESVTAATTVSATGDHALYGIWKAQYTVSFNYKTGSGESKTVYRVVNEEEAAEPPANEIVNAYVGHTFTGWNSSAYTRVLWNLSVEANYRANTYTIAYNANGGTGTTAEQAVTYGQTVSLNANDFTSPDYKTFVGWSTNASATVADYQDRQTVKNLTDKDGVTVTLYALWATHAYAVAFDANGGAGSPVRQVFTHGVATNLLLNTYEAPTGTTFQGWSLTRGGAVAYTDGQLITDDLTDTFGATVTLYAVWKANTYTIAYDANGGTGTMVSQTVAYGQEVYLRENEFVSPDPALAFVGWSTNATAEVADYKDGQLVKDLTAEKDATVTLYAIWKANSYAVEFDPNGGTGNTRIQTFECGVAQELWANTFEPPSGMVFAGWATTNTPGAAVVYLDKQRVKDLTTVAGSTVTLYAAWEKARANTVYYNPGREDVEESPVRDTFTVNEPYTLKGEIFTSTTARLIGWSRTRGASTPTWGLGDQTTFATDAAVTLYGIWKAEPCTIHYHDAEGSRDSYDTSAIVGVPLTLPYNLADSPRVGYVVTNWLSSVYNALYAPGDSYKPVLGTNHLEATGWDPIHYTIQFDANGAKGTMPDIPATYDTPIKLPENAFTHHFGLFKGWTTNKPEFAFYPFYESEDQQKDKIGGRDLTKYDFYDCATVTNLVAKDGAKVMFYAIWATTNKLQYALGLTNEIALACINDVYLTGETVVSQEKDVHWSYTNEGGKTRVEFGLNSVAPMKLCIHAQSSGQWVLYLDQSPDSSSTLNVSPKHEEVQDEGDGWFKVIINDSDYVNIGGTSFTIKNVTFTPTPSASEK